MVDIADLAEKLNTQYNWQLELPESRKFIYAKRENLVQLLKALKEEFKFERLADIAAVDYIDYYEVVYHLLNNAAELLAIKIKVDKNDCTVPSIVSLWKAADPQEREAYDLMGIIFEGHGNLTRILCPEDFDGHPLQKSFKLDLVNRFEEKAEKGGK